MSFRPSANVSLHDDLVSLVNPLCGSDSDLTYSTGLTYLAVGVPWGMTYFSPRNRSLGHVFCRRPSLPVCPIYGFTATHAPSPHMGEYGSFTLMPYPGPAADVPTTTHALACAYRLDEEVCQPDRFNVRLVGSGIGCELTATSSVGLLRISVPASIDRLRRPSARPRVTRCSRAAIRTAPTHTASSQSARASPRCRRCSTRPATAPRSSTRASTATRGTSRSIVSIPTTAATPTSMGG